MNTFKKVVLSGTPHERGVTYGRECRELMAAAFRYAVHLLHQFRRERFYGGYELGRHLYCIIP